MKNKIILIFTIAVLIANLNFVLSQDIIWSGESPVDFTVVDSYPRCDYDLFVWKYWDEIVGGIVKEPSLNDCYRDNVDDRDSTTCCPVGRECVREPGPNFGTCRGLPAPAYCSDYNETRYGGSIELAEEYCKGFHKEVAERTVNELKNEDGFCGSTQRKYVSSVDETCSFVISSCRCVWDDAGEKCMQAYSESNLTCPSGVVPNEGDCILNTTNIENNCDSTGKILYEWIADWIRMDGTPGVEDLTGTCNDDSREVPCVSTAILTFFTTLSLIIAILLLIIFYAIIIRKRKKYKGKKSRKKKL